MTRADGELHPDLGVVDRLVPALEDADQEQPGDEGQPDAVAHGGVHRPDRLSQLHHQAAEQRRPADEVEEDEDVLEELHGAQGSDHAKER